MKHIKYTIVVAVILSQAIVIFWLLSLGSDSQCGEQVVRVELAGLGEHSDIPRPFWGTVHKVVSKIEHQGELVRHGDNFQIFGAYPQTYVVHQKYQFGELIEDGFTIIAAGSGDVSFGQTFEFFSPFDWESYMEWFDEKNRE